MTEYIKKQALLSELARYNQCYGAESEQAKAAYLHTVQVVSTLPSIDVVEQKNPKPLTLDELKDMHGEPVYCVDSKGNGKWAFVEDYDEVCIDSDYEDWEFYCYGWDNDDGWLAYRSNPKEAGQ